MQAKDRKSESDSKIVQFTSTVAGKLPPHSLALEEAVAGGLLADPRSIGRIADKATPEDFYCEPARLIFQAALELHTARRAADVVSILQWLTERNLLERVGGQSGLIGLMECTVSAVNIDLYVKDLNALRIRRQLIRAAQAQIELAQDPALEIQDIVSQSSTSLNQAAYGYSATKGRTISEVCLAIEQEFERGASTGIPTGIYDLDDLIGGLQQQELLIVAGATGSGKTQLAVYLTYVAAAQGYPVMFFSCEMSDVRIGDRMLAHVSSVDSNRIHQRNVDTEEMERIQTGKQMLSALPVRFCDERRLTTAIMRSELNECAAQFGKPYLVILDYLQLLGGGAANRVTELDQITKECRAIAQEFDVCFVSLAQINRAVSTRQVKEPTLADLRESGGIEQSADRVILLYRDEYYNPDSVSRGKAKLIIAKNRYSSVGNVEVLFLPQFSQFKNIAKGRTYESEPATRPNFKAVLPSPVTASDSADEWGPVQSSASSREECGITFHLNRQYRITLDALDEEGKREMRKTPDFDQRLGVGKVVTIVGWDDDDLGWCANTVDFDGNTQTISPLFLMEVES